MIDIAKYWLEPPPEQSPGLKKWLEKVRRGWRPNRRIRQMGYYTAAEYFEVYIWEYLNVLSPAIHSEAG